MNYWTKTASQLSTCLLVYALIYAVTKIKSLKGSWISGDVAYDADSDRVLYLQSDATVTEEFIEEMSETVGQFVHINNLILETDYYEE